MKDVEGKKGWVFDETLLGGKRTSIQAHFDVKRAEQLGVSQEEIKRNLEYSKKGNEVIVVIWKVEKSDSKDLETFLKESSKIKR